MSAKYNFGVLGRHIGYSRSADIFAAVGEELGVVIHCDLISVEPNEVADWIAKLSSRKYRGFSVTIPYKEKVIPMLDELDHSAAMIDAVNSVWVRDNKLIGFNTDIAGFAYPLQHAEPVPSITQALIIGCGGAARAVVASLVECFGCKAFWVTGRSEEKLSTFKAKLTRSFPDITINTISAQQKNTAQPSAFDIVINCTPLGGWNDPGRQPLPIWFDWTSASIYYDLNYNDRNASIADARAHAVRAFDGSAMLVAQALKSLEHWTGLKADFEKVYARVFPGSDNDVG